MESEGADEFPLFLIGLLFERAEPVVDAILRQPVAGLGGKDIRTGLVTASMLEVVILYPCSCSVAGKRKKSKKEVA